MTDKLTFADILATIRALTPRHGKRFDERAAARELTDRWAREAFEVFASKAPVDYPGPQSKADAAWREIEQWLTAQECQMLSTERDHALLGEGREKFDAEIARVRNRLGWHR